MTCHRGSQSRIGIRSLTWLLAGFLALALLLGVAATRPIGALASTNTSCDRDALQSALTAGQATITFAPGCTISFAPTETDPFGLDGLTLPAGVNVTIEGNGLKLAGDTEIDIIDIADTKDSPSTLTLKQVTLDSGYAGVYEDPLISAATVELEGCTVAGTLGSSLVGISAANVTVTDSTFTGNGKGITGGSAKVVDSTFSNNGLDINTTSANVSGSTLNASTFASIQTTGDTTVTSSTINSSHIAGAIDSKGDVTVGHSSIIGNAGISIQGSDVKVISSLVDGAGASMAVTGVQGNNVELVDSTIRNFQTGVDSLSKAVVSGSVISGNVTGVAADTATVSGSFIRGTKSGVITDQGINAETVTVIGSTISNFGTGINATSDVELIGSTLSGNGNAIVTLSVTADTSTISGNDTTGIVADHATLRSTLLAVNGHNCQLNALVGPLIDLGDNRADDTSCHPFTDSTSKTVVTTDLKLLPLGNYGGPLVGSPTSQQVIPTVALGPRSVAIDAVPAGECPMVQDPTTKIDITTDQRGVSRPQGSGCDIGAFEAIQGPVITLDPTSPPVDQNGWFNAQQTTPDGLVVKVSASHANDIDVLVCTIGQTTMLSLSGSDNDLTVSGTVRLPPGISLLNCNVGATLPFTLPDPDPSADNETLTVAQTYQVDSTAPYVECSPDTSTTWTNQNVEVDCNAVDLNSGLATGTPDYFTLTTSVPDNGYAADAATPKRTICDVANNCTTVGPFTFAVDLSKPTFKCDPQTSEGWSSQNITVTCSAADAGSNLDANSPSSFSLTTAVLPGHADEDAATNSQLLCDLAGNCVTAGPYSFAIDLATPSVSCTISTTPVGGWFTSTVTVTCSGNDDGSGIASIDYALDGKATSVSGKESFTVDVSADGTHTFSYSATDKADNSTTPPAFSFQIDATKPTVTISSPSDKVVFLIGQTDGTHVSYSCTDPNAPDGATGSGLATTNSCVGVLDGAATSSGTTLNTSADAIGPHTLQVTATDQAGNTNSQTVTYQVEALNAPTITINGGTGYTSVGYWYNLSNSPNGVALTVSDSNSLVTSYACTDNGNALSLTLSDDTPPHGTVDLQEGIHELSCTATASSTGTSSNPTTATVRVDRTRPIVTAPLASHPYVLNSPVKLTCADPTGANNAAGSGIASCQVTVTLPDKTTQTVTMPDSLPTGEVGSYTVKAVNVADVAGNTTTTGFGYTVGYTTPALLGNTATVRRGYYAVIRFAPEDANGHDYASRKLKVASVELDGDGQTIAFAHAFQFGTFSGTKGYQLSINTRNLSSGTWTLLVTVGSDKTRYAIVFSVQ